jgi:L-ribulose-5-phosphate 3-epimerase
LDEVNSPWVGIHLDVGNIHDTGFAEQWIEINGSRITRVHVKDVFKHRGRCGQESVYTNLFLGDNNWRAIRDAMNKVRYDGWIIAEMEARYHYAPDQQIFDTSAAMSRFISGQL